MLLGVISERKANGMPRNEDKAEMDWQARKERRWNATKGYRLGWVNPTLYGHASAFMDITEGNNLDGRGITCPSDKSAYTENFDDGNNDEDGWNNYLDGPAGYYATAGWDPVTGLGAVDFPGLRSIFSTSTTTDDGADFLGVYYEDEYYDAETDREREEISPPPPPCGYYGGACGSYEG